MSRYNIYDFLSPKSKERFDAIVAKNEIIVDDETLRVAKLARSSFTSGSNLLLTTVNRHIELKRAPEVKALGIVDEQTIRDDFDHNLNLVMLYVKLRVALDEELTNEAIQAFITEEKIKNFTVDLKELIKKESLEKDQTKAQIYLDQRFQHQIQMLEQVNAEKARIIDEIKKINEAQREIRENLAKLETLKDSIIDKHSARIAKDIKNIKFPSGAKHFENKTDAQIQAFVKDLIVTKRGLEQELQMENAVGKKLKADVQRLEDERKNIIKEIGASNGLNKENTQVLGKHALTTMHNLQKAANEHPKMRQNRLELEDKQSQLKDHEARKQKIEEKIENLYTTVSDKHGLTELAASSEDQNTLSQHFQEKEILLNNELRVVDDMKEKMEGQLGNLQSSKEHRIETYNNLIKNVNNSQQLILKNNDKLEESKSKLIANTLKTGTTLDNDMASLLADDLFLENTQDTKSTSVSSKLT